jgi:hypothetical protein
VKSMNKTTRRGRVAMTGIAVLIVATLSAGTAAAVVAGFNDVPDNHPHAAGIAYLASTGITGGCAANLYCPETAVNRGQMATFIRRLSGADPLVAPSVRAASLAGYQVVERADTMAGDASTFNGAVLACPAGKHAVGGGAVLSSFQAAVNQSGPSADGTSWDVDVVRLNGTAAVTITIRVICLPV